MLHRKAGEKLADAILHYVFAERVSESVNAPLVPSHLRTDKIDPTPLVAASLRFGDQQLKNWGSCGRMAVPGLLIRRARRRWGCFNVVSLGPGWPLVPFRDIARWVQWTFAESLTQGISMCTEVNASSISDFSLGLRYFE